jgi:hypothetical protein
VSEAGLVDQMPLHNWEATLARQVAAEDSPFRGGTSEQFACVNIRELVHADILGKKNRHQAEK